MLLLVVRFRDYQRGLISQARDILSLGRFRDLQTLRRTAYKGTMGPDQSGTSARRIILEWLPEKGVLPLLPTIIILCDYQTVSCYILCEYQTVSNKKITATRHKAVLTHFAELNCLHARNKKHWMPTVLTLTPTVGYCHISEVVFVFWNMMRIWRWMLVICAH